MNIVHKKPFTDEEVEAFRKKWDKMHAGSFHGEIKILDVGVKYYPTWSWVATFFVIGFIAGLATRWMGF
jgi:hypothetical protein